MCISEGLKLSINLYILYWISSTKFYEQIQKAYHIHRFPLTSQDALLTLHQKYSSPTSHGSDKWSKVSLEESLSKQSS